ncbi:MAG: ATPase [Pseudomonadota bacterium]
MIYDSPEAYLDAPRKAVALIGMSGLGKTCTAAMLRDSGDWFHYSIDYRIGTRYMGEHITDNVKREAMKVPFLAELLKSDSIYIASNITFENLAPLSTYLGKPGNPEKGGIPFAEYLKRQREHREAEISALLDTGLFRGKAEDIYGYAHFLADTGGSICEVVDPTDPADPVLTALSCETLIVQIRGNETLEEELCSRFERAPKPMYYPEPLLLQLWAAFCDAHGYSAEEADTKVDPDAFIAHGFRTLLNQRVPRYDAIGERWGVVVDAAEVAALRTADDFDALIADAIRRRHAPMRAEATG